MKRCSRLAGLVSPSQNLTTTSPLRIGPLIQIRQLTRVADARFTHTQSLSPLRALCRRPLTGYKAGRTAFSTSSPRRSEDAKPQPSGEGTEGVAQAGGKPVYPERLIIYHAGTGKTTFLACLKVTTLFVFGFFDMIVAPAYLASGEPLLKTAGVALCGLIPALYVSWATSPFVAAIHLHLPPYARWSRAILTRFARTAPPATTRLDVTTVSLIGKPRVSSMVLGDLRPVDSSSGAGGKGLATRLRQRLGAVNYERDTTLLDKRRAWWRFRAVGQFAVQEGGKETVKTGWVWREISEGIKKRGGPSGGSGVSGREKKV